MDDSFESARRKISRAQFHIDDFKQRVAVFENSNPYEPLAEVNPNAPDVIVHKLKRSIPMPEWLSEIAGDAVNNLREALDHAAYAVSVPPRSKCYFPFGSDVIQFETSMKGNSRDIPVEMRDLFRSLQPYKGGNDLLWSLNQVCRINKHAVLTTFGVGIDRDKEVTLRHSHDREIRVFFPEPMIWNAAEAETIVAVSKTEDPGFQFQNRITIAIEFDNVDPVRGQEATVVLDKFAGMVQSILSTIEAEARRLWPDRFP